MTNPDDPISATEHDIASGQGGTIPGNWKHLGLTKREYFATMAMTGILACQQASAETIGLAKDSVKMADALIAELNKETKP